MSAPTGRSRRISPEGLIFSLLDLMVKMIGYLIFFLHLGEAFRKGKITLSMTLLEIYFLYKADPENPHS